MDKFQATPPEELERLRGLSARHFGQLFLLEALRRLREMNGDEALGRFEAEMTQRVDNSEGEIACFGRMKELAIEQLNVTLKQVRDAGD